VRDAAVLGLAFCETDFHPAPREARPAAVRVEVRLLEAKRVAVEPAPRLQVANVVPDAQSVDPIAELRASYTRMNRLLQFPRCVTVRARVPVRTVT